MTTLDLSEQGLQHALKNYEELFSQGDVEAILRGFADDVSVRYASYEPFVGKDRLRKMLHARFSTMRDYRLVKRLEFVKPPRFASSWTGSWIDAAGGAKMELFGLEVLTVRDGLFSEWSASVSVWRSGQATAV